MLVWLDVWLTFGTIGDVTRLGVGADTLSLPPKNPETAEAAERIALMIPVMRS
jgi:hypothetical protein